MGGSILDSFFLPGNGWRLTKNMQVEKQWLKVGD